MQISHYPTFYYPLDLMDDRFNNSYLQLTFFEYVIEGHGDKNIVNENDLNRPIKTEFGKSGDSINLNSMWNSGATMLTSGIVGGLAKINNLQLSSNRTATLTGSVKLPLPKNIKNNNNISWSDTDMTKVNIVNASSDSIREAGGNERFSHIITQLYQVMADKKDGRGDDIMTHAKSALADMTDQTYKGIDKRTLSFDWTFLVTTKKEAMQLKNLIDFIENRVLPSTSRSGIGLDNYFLTYPDSVNVNFMYNGKNNRYLPKYNDMVITSFDVDYGDSGATGLYMLEDGEPVTVKMAISLKEKYARVRNHSGTIKNQSTFDYQ